MSSGTSAAVESWIGGIVALASLPRSAPDGSHLAVVLAPPSPELAGALLGAASVTDVDPAEHKPEEFGENITYVNRQKLYDRVLLRSKKERRISLHAEFDVSNLPLMVARPSRLEERADSVIPGEVLGDLTESELILRAKEYFRYCVKPVVILTTRPAELAAYMELLNQTLNVWGASEQQIRFATSNSLDSWFRSPVLIVSPEQTRLRAWVSEVSPVAVIAIGWRTWKKPARWHWPNTTHYLLLDVRSDDVEHFRAYHDGTDGIQHTNLNHEDFVGPHSIGASPRWYAVMTASTASRGSSNPLLRYGLSNEWCSAQLSPTIASS